MASSGLAEAVARLNDPKLAPTTVLEILNSLLENEKALVEDLDGRQKIMSGLNLVLVCVANPTVIFR